MSRTKIKAPEGYRLAKIGEIKKLGYKIFRATGWDMGIHVGDRVERGDCPIANKITNKPAPAKWEPIPADTKLTKAKVIALANKLGAENARLKARLAKGGK